MILSTRFFYLVDYEKGGEGFEDMGGSYLSSKSIRQAYQYLLIYLIIYLLPRPLARVGTEKERMGGNLRKAALSPLPIYRTRGALLPFPFCINALKYLPHGISPSTPFIILYRLN